MCGDPGKVAGYVDFMGKAQKENFLYMWIVNLIRSAGREKCCFMGVYVLKKLLCCLF